MLVNKTCIVCGKEFQTDFHWGSPRNTCSEKCRYKLLSDKFSSHHTKMCIQCGKEFKSFPKSKKKLCSLTCKLKYMAKLLGGKNNPNWKPVKSLRPASKRSLRNHIKERDRICQDCGSTQKLQVHHVDSNPQNNDDSNLVLLCNTCHSKRHANKGEGNLVTLIMSNRVYHHKPERHCIVCGKTFVPKRETNQCCSVRCAQIQSGRALTGKHRKT